MSRLKVCVETLLKEIFDEYELKMNFEQYVLVGSTVCSYLPWMKDSGKVEAAFRNNMVMWNS